jgi:hypothetical protein
MATKNDDTKKVEFMSMDEFINELGTNFNAVKLSRVLKMSDGGKLIRRHLRGKFAEKQNHTHGDNWNFTSNDNEIIEYFYSKFPVAK